MDNTYLLQSRRTEYLRKFQKTTTSLFIEGVYSIYNNVKNNNKSKRLLLKEFQQSMVDVSRWSQDIITNEHMRFKKASSVLDKLIKAIFDLDIVLKKELCKNAEDFIPHPRDFIHQCYLNIARALWKQPFLVYDVNIDKLTIQQNKLKIEKIVSLCIQDTYTQYLPLDIEHDDVSNIDYSIQINQDLIKDETCKELNEEYGDNNDIVSKENDLDVFRHYVSDCNDNFKKLDHEINSNLHENLNVFKNKQYDLDDCDKRDVNEDNIYTQDTFEEYVNVNHDDERTDINKETDSFSDECEVVQSEIDEDEVSQCHEATLTDDDIMCEEEDMRSDELYETKSFHSEDVGDVDSVDSKELYISHYEQNTDEKYDDMNTIPAEIKNIIIGDNLIYDNEMMENNEVQDDEQQTDIKVITIDDNKSRLSSKKDSLLNIKRKVKSSMHQSREKKHDNKYERYADRIQVERKSTSFF